MSLTAQNTACVLLVLAALLTAAHGMGHLFARFRQPRVIGEIVGGLVLGPSGLSALAPEWKHTLLPDGGASQAVLGGISQLGLLLLLFCSGMEIRSTFQGGERKVSLSITFFGTVLPFGAGLIFLNFKDPSDLMGSAQSSTAFLLVFAIAIAVTSIPVISRIMFDLNILETPFARIVLSAAVIEDVVLYVVLAIAIGMVGRHEESFGVAQLLSLDPSSRWANAYHVVATLAFFAFSLLVGKPLFRRVLNLRTNFLYRSSPIAFLIIFMLLVTALAIFLGIPPMFGAFIAGMVAGSSSENVPPADAEPQTTRRVSDRPREAIKSFSFAFFIPVYFAIVGFRLDLLRDFYPGFFAVFLTYACVAKLGSVYLGATIAGESRRGALNLAVAMNARGGPGIVLASVAYDGHIINEAFYVSLVMLAIVTSLLAGTWLESVVRGDKPIR
jgi:Kef-type K+ transport system membrane component KefB